VHHAGTVGSIERVGDLTADLQHVRERSAFLVSRCARVSPSISPSPDNDVALAADVAARRCVVERGDRLGFAFEIRADPPDERWCVKLDRDFATEPRVLAR
jgi:hypothetical protein